MRQIVYSQEIQHFLEALGKAVHIPCKIFFVGGTSLVFFGLREQTIDIDLTFEVDNVHHGKLIDAIRRLKEELNLNIEEASPGDFIPLPPGWRDRCIYIGTFGTVIAFHFDLYSTALSKLERGTHIDFEDIRMLLQNGKIIWEKFEELYHSILPDYGTKSLKQDPVRIRRNFEILKELIKVK
jgi:hypothetical protein